MSFGWPAGHSFVRPVRTREETDMTDSTLDLGPQARIVARLTRTVSDAQLAAPTPCPDTPVRHLLHLSIAFRDAARKDLGVTTDTNPGATVPDLPPAGARSCPQRWTNWRTPGATPPPGRARPAPAEWTYPARSRAPSPLTNWSSMAGTCPAPSTSPTPPTSPP